jgi:hypothetical protein
MDEDLPISGENIPPALLTLLIDISAKQEAMFNLVVDHLIKRGEDESKLMETFDEDYYAAKDAIVKEFMLNTGTHPFFIYSTEWNLHSPNTLKTCGLRCS